MKVRAAISDIMPGKNSVRINHSLTAYSLYNDRRGDFNSFLESRSSLASQVEVRTDASVRTAIDYA